MPAADESCAVMLLRSRSPKRDPEAMSATGPWVPAPAGLPAPGFQSPAKHRGRGQGWHRGLWDTQDVSHVSKPCRGIAVWSLGISTELPHLFKGVKSQTCSCLPCKMPRHPWSLRVAQGPCDLLGTVSPAACKVRGGRPLVSAAPLWRSVGDPAALHGWVCS